MHLIWQPEGSTTGSAGRQLSEVGNLMPDKEGGQEWRAERPQEDAEGEKNYIVGKKNWKAKS